ncbi:uncharacterized protein Z519_00440 [Cladophialophora bantiana CBS 173.52]|uniref:FAD-binding domain-containing protein n=1 Tax=Cladophialophora bantiana (strain ATCC 10958 / CBS 173.52 / CDC B-1940 / NIH 8579) TaxID=1442370 RepID=A0A0D2GK48_CLAB1|nr:uncharacterized protein Z519_00440 [Cladophialophora bantiana CBS 173.52]KIW98777.1 hypothetical protein Z519_00440 [Cladophialophora bantiana CBS 173.52]
METQNQETLDRYRLQVVVVGAGIGGLACAIACRRANPPLAVTVVERAPEILTIGAGIHIPPNACRIVTHLGLLEELKQAKAYSVEGFTLRRYKDGSVIVEKPMGERMEREYGAKWLAIHRGDYQNALLDAARKNGATILTNAEVTGIEQGTGEALGKQIVLLKDGNRMIADVVVGADGLWSGIREFVLGRPMPPVETGDLAYRGTFSREQLKGFKDERIDKLIEASNVQVWLGSGRHAVFYPLRNKTEYNLVLICADNLPEGVRASQGSLEEMAANFEGWDPSLSTIISCLKSALKWKLLHFKELDQWTKGPVALLGDASHPTLPYQGQGAAMAVEDGAILGLLLSRLQNSGISLVPEERATQLADLLHLYEDLRKKRTEVNVAGAVHTRHFYHLSDGDEQVKRDQDLARLPASDWQGACSFNWGDAAYQKSLLGFDVLADAERNFDDWLDRGYTSRRKAMKATGLL